MKSIKNRERYKTGKTDYSHRLKLLRNYSSTIRVYLCKKNKFYACGIYHTPDVTRSDLSYGYYQSRWLKLSDGTHLTANQKSLKAFGAVIGQELNNKHVTYDFTQKALVLDIGRRKHICFKSFLEGLFSTLDPVLRSNFRIRDSLKDSLQPYTEQIPTFR